MAEFFPALGGQLFADANGLRITPGGDIDADLISVDVTGTPKLSWDESENAFSLSKSLVIGSPQSDGPHAFGVRGTFPDTTMRHVQFRNDATTAGCDGLEVITADGVQGIVVKHDPHYTGTPGYAGTTQFYQSTDSADHSGNPLVSGNRCGVGTIIGSNTTGSFVRFEIGPSYPVSEVMRVTTVGLGIGTHEPIARLEVVKGSGSSLIRLRTQGTVTDPTTTARVEGTDYALLSLGVDATQFYWQATKGAGGTAKNLAFWTDAAEAFTILQTGANISIGAAAAGTDAVKTITIGLGTAPSTSPADVVQLYVADQAAGNACLHTRTEGGAVVKLFQGAAVADATDAASTQARLNDLLARMRKWADCDITYATSAYL